MTIIVYIYVQFFWGVHNVYMQTIASILRKHTLRYLPLDTICSAKRTVFRKRTHSSRKTGSFKEQLMSKDKYTRIFSCQMGLLCWGYQLDIPQFEGIFSHTMHLDQSRASENIWWNIMWNIPWITWIFTVYCTDLLLGQFIHVYQENANDSWDNSWFTKREHYITIFYRVTENTAANTIYHCNTGIVHDGKVGLLLSNMQWLSCSLIGCIFYGMVYNVINYVTFMVTVQPGLRLGVFGQCITSLL